MVFGKKNHLVGLDIGAAFIKVAELKVSKQGNTLKNFGIAPVPGGIIEDGRIMDMEELARIIRDLFTSLKIKEKNVAISTGGNSVVIKTINTTKVPDKDLHATILAEAEQYIPYDIEDVNIDYQVLGESEFSPDQINVLLVAVKKDLVAEYMELITMAGLNPSIIDVDTFALQNVYEILPDTDVEQVTLLVDVGASKTSLNILQHNTSMMMRDMMTGANQIIEALADRMDMDFEAAANLLMDPGEQGENRPTVMDVCQGVVNAWCAEISDVVRTFESNANDIGVDKIMLSGGGCYVEGFAQSLNQELDVPVESIDPFAGIEVNEKQFPQSMLAKVGLMAPIALGLSLRRVDDK